MDVIDRTGECVAGRYRLRDLIARGAHTAVWSGRDELLHRDVAVKVLDASAGWLSWTREARAVASVRHENVVAVHDAGESEIGPYVVMELVRGETLAARLARGPVTPEEARRITDSLLSGLAAVHARGLVHRDVKPSNIILADDGRVVLTDFGTARAATSDTTEAAVVGTPGYMAPERAAGAPGSAAADVFAAALVIEDLDPTPMPAVAAVLAVATADDPNARPRDAAELRARLASARGSAPARPVALAATAARDGETEPYSQTVAMHASPRPHRRRALAIGALAALAVAGTAVVGLAPTDRAAPPASPTSAAATTGSASTSSTGTTAIARAKPAHPSTVAQVRTATTSTRAASRTVRPPSTPKPPERHEKRKGKGKRRRT